jgi:hypothetical protein
MSTYLEIAKRRWNCPIIGRGGFAIAVISKENGGIQRVELFESAAERNAVAAADYPSSKRVDLELPIDLERIPDRYYERSPRA